MNRALLTGLMMASWSGMGMRGIGGLQRDPFNDYDLTAEYELIQQKKSTLSKSQRDRIVRIHERRLAEKEAANG